jgi:hypothetical protein
MEAADDLRVAHTLDLCRAALQHEGIEAPADREGMVRASLTTHTLTEALGAAVNKVLLDGYQESPATWRSFAGVRSVPDFKTATAIRPSFTGSLQQIPPGGEFKHGGADEATTQYKVDTYGKMFSIDRRDLINDDLSLFDSVARAMGQAAMRKLSDLVYDTLLSNAGAFFSAGNGNYITGADTNLSTDGLTKAITAMLTQRDAEGNDLDLRPTRLVVPPELQTVARAVLESEYIAAQTNLPTGNSLRNAVGLEVEPRLSNTKKYGTKASTKHWYLFAAPAASPIIVGFLNGQQTPTVEFFGLRPDGEQVGGRLPRRRRRQNRRLHAALGQHAGRKRTVVRGHDGDGGGVIDSLGLLADTRRCQRNKVGKFVAGVAKEGGPLDPVKHAGHVDVPLGVLFVLFAICFDMLLDRPGSLELRGPRPEFRCEIQRTSPHRGRPVGIRSLLVQTNQIPGGHFPHALRVFRACTARDGRKVRDELREVVIGAGLGYLSNLQFGRGRLSILADESGRQKCQQARAYLLGTRQDRLTIELVDRLTGRISLHYAVQCRTDCPGACFLTRFCSQRLREFVKVRMGSPFRAGTNDRSGEFVNRRVHDSLPHVPGNCARCRDCRHNHSVHARTPSSDCWEVGACSCGRCRGLPPPGTPRSVSGRFGMPLRVSAWVACRTLRCGRAR